MNDLLELGEVPEGKVKPGDPAPCSTERPCSLPQTINVKRNPASATCNPPHPALQLRIEFRDVKLGHFMYDMAIFC